MARKLAFTIEVEGANKVASDLTKVELELSSISKELRQVKKDIDVFNTGTDEQRKALEKSGKSIEGLESSYKGLRAQQEGLRVERNKLNTELRDQAKAFDLVKRSVPETSLIGLRQTYKELRKEINLMDKAARESVKGLEKIEQADGIKKQIDEIGDSVSDFRSRVGGYRQALESVISSFSGNSGLGAIVSPIADAFAGGGGIQGGLSSFTNLLGGIPGIASIAVGALASIAKFTADITVEFERLNNQVGNTTELFGQDLQKATVDVKTLSEVFDQEFNEVLRAANTLTKEVTGDFTESIKLIELGFLAGADANGDFLDSIIEYSTQIRAAGASGEEFIEILIRSQREGIFSDKGVDLVKEFGLRIREQTTATSTALEEAFGGDFTKRIFDGINDGSINSVQALSEVSNELKKGQITAKQSQQLLADVFGGPGEDAGRRFIEILGEVDGNLDKLIDNSDAYTRKQIDILDATRDLNTEQQLLASQFAGTGFSIEAFGTKVQAFGTSVLNQFILSYRALFKEVSEGNILTGLAGFINPLVSASTKAEILLEDAEALREVTEGQTKAAEDLRKAAVAGSLGVNQLTQEQQKLKAQIDSNRAAGKDYTKDLEDYQKITENITAATKVFNTNIKKTEKTFKESAKDGSIDQLTEKVRKLQSQINATGNENKAKELIEELNEADLDLSQATKELEDFKQQIRKANVETLPIEDQVDIYKEGIERRRQLDLQAAESRITDEKQLALEIQKINAEQDNLISDQDLRLLEDGSSEALAILNEVAARKEEISDIELSIKLVQKETLLEEATVLSETLLRKTIENEEELQTRLQLLRSSSASTSIQNQLNLEALSARERLDLETELQKQLQEQKALQAKVDIDFDTKSADIETSEDTEIGSIIPTFDPTDIAASLQAIEDFETKRTELLLLKEIERFELQRELALQQNESTQELDNQIALKKLELNKATNDELIEQNSERIAQEQRQQQEALSIVTETIMTTGDLLGDIFDGSIESAQEANRRFIELMLDTVEKVIQLQVAAVVAREIGTKGFAGVATGAILSALINVGFNLAKRAITSEDGNILGETTYKNGGRIVKGPRHAQGGVKFRVKGDSRMHEYEGGEAVINRKSTAKYKGLLSAINEAGGGKKLASNSSKYYDILKMQGGGILGPSLDKLENIPQLVNPQIVVAKAGFSDEQIEQLGEMLGAMIGEKVETGAEKGSRVGLENGSDEANRRAERQRLLDQQTG